MRLENSHVITQKQVSIGSLEKSPDNKLLSSAYENRFALTLKPVAIIL